MATCGLHGCGRPCFQRAGVVHDFCGRSHAKAALGERLAPPHGICHRCQLYGCDNDVYFDEETETVHDFCCRGHADLAMAKGEWPLPHMRGYSQCRLQNCSQLVFRDPATGQESEYCSRSHANQGRDILALKCQHPLCQRPAWVDPSTQALLTFCGSWCARLAFAYNFLGQSQCSLPGCVEVTMLNCYTGQELGYCCVNHRNRAEQRSLSVNTEPFVDRTFRGGTTGDDDFQLKVLTNEHPDYASLKEQFFTKWIKPVYSLRVERIFKVQVPAHVHQAHSEYERNVNNTRRRFHGTSCSASCNFFVDLKGGPCGERSCSVCNICTHGFKLQGYLGRTAQLTNTNLRYSEGLYFSSVSGKANDYADKSEKVDRRGKRWRCMFTASVAVGRAFKTQSGNLPPEMCPPPGFDSVVGEVGGVLNYDEVVVYQEQAALPTFLIVYSLE